ncbi:unnamed protein product [Heligmosomoides polygyrus]|uniref:Transthyretin-like family protein n=1 Tax=Heligmosomoides polygyrus TaxID=6339 RepID=A0A183FMX1_HELPZ|nr:unnamed protein product [Heligmosomoides polygyrus]
MDYLLLLCWIDSFPVYGSDMFMHSSNTAALKGLISLDLESALISAAIEPGDASQEDQARRHRTNRDEKATPLYAAYDSGEELFLETCDSRGVGSVGVLVYTPLAMNIDSYESLTTRIGRLQLKRCGAVPASTVYVTYAPTSDYDDKDVEAFTWSFRSCIRKITPYTR